MYSVFNTVAYDGMMIHGGDPRPTGDLLPSRWIHVTGPARGHYVPAELQVAEKLISSLLAGVDHEPVKLHDIIVISPFRDVAAALSNLRRRYGTNLRAGTVHTAQGKEARVVILVLGGDPQRPGAKRWAASDPNLVNVATSRARDRLYVVGDEKVWSRYRYFDTMSKLLADESGTRAE
jgi:superfamily I DNA and/or RNA helicase